MKRPLIAIAAVVVLGAGVAFAQVDFDDVPEDHEHFYGINYAVYQGWFNLNPPMGCGGWCREMLGSAS